MTSVGSTSAATGQSTSEIGRKVARLRSWMQGAGLSHVVLRRPGNVAWLSAGGRSHIVQTLDAGVASLVVSADTVQVVTTSNEAGRLQEEELAGLDADWFITQWDSDLTAAIPAGPHVGSDQPQRPSEHDLKAAIAQLRASLEPEEVQRYAALSTDTATAATDTLLTVRSSVTEHEVAADFAHALIARGIDPVVIQVAGAERLPTRRHALPTDALVGSAVLISCCARRHGLFANLSRIAWLRPPTGQHRDEYAELLGVERAFLTATVVGEPIGAAFAAGVAAYSRHRFAEDEWTKHHQGGPTGYEPRDFLATADSDTLISERQAFAWNPTAPGLKVEDTVLATSSGLVVLTCDPRWPTTEVDGRARPLPLEP